MQKKHEKNKVGIGDYQAKGSIARQRDIGQKAGYRVQDENQRIVETRRELGGEEPAEGTIPHRLLSENKLKKSETPVISRVSRFSKSPLIRF